MNLIRDYFYVLGIDPNTVPGDEGRLSAIRKKYWMICWKKLMRKKKKILSI